MIAKSLQEAELLAARLKAPSFAAFDIPVSNALDEVTYILGLPLVAAIMGQDPAQIEAWSAGVEMSSSEDIALRTALHASRMISCRLPASIVRRWFISPCDEIQGRSPLEAISKMAEDGSLDTRSKITLAAERYWKIR